MHCKYASEYDDQASFGCLVLFFPEDRISAPKFLSPALRMEVGRLAALKDFTGKSGQCSVLPSPSGAIARLLCVGMGKGEKLDPEMLRRAAGTAARELTKMNLETAGVIIPDVGEGMAYQSQLGEIFGEGMIQGAYKFEKYKENQTNSQEKKKVIKNLTFFDPEKSTSENSLKKGVARGEAVNFARDLSNQPANFMTPSDLAREAEAIAKKRKLKIKILEKDEMIKLGLNMLLGVAKGSSQPPKLIILEYRSKQAKSTLAFVGKGITFDSGGISLKPGKAMDEMKFDMCGAAAVLGAMDAIAASRPKVNIVAVIPACENLPDGSSLKPGDILRSYSGKHVEILNTDAEGRLILGDALAYTIKKFNPDAIVDLATLTGACVVALGHYATGAVSNNDELLEKVVQAGKSSGEIVWPLPNFPEYEEELKGKYADLQNIGSREGGAITAGLFLKNFVGEVPWVHLDIAGTAWGVKNIGYIPDEGATGVGVRLLTDLAADWGGN